MRLGQVVGRDVELAVVRRFLDGVPAESRALLVEGEPGIGKTTIWVAAIDEAEARGIRVLQTRAAETEVQLSYAAMTDLVGADFEETRSDLPAVQQRALAAALLRAEADEPAQARTVATAFGGVLGAADASSGLGSAASLVAASSGAPPIAVSFAAAVPPSGGGSSGSPGAVVFTIIGPRMPRTSW